MLVTVVAGGGAGLVAVLTHQGMRALQRLVWATGDGGQDVASTRIAITIFVVGIWCHVIWH